MQMQVACKAALISAMLLGQVKWACKAALILPFF